MAVQIQFRRGTASEWTTADPTLAAGELAIETDTDFYKIGDGSTAWTSLGYSSLPSGTAPLASPTFTGTVTMADLVVNGTTSTINSATLTVDDKNIELGSVASPSDTTADGGGITLKGATDKTITWVNSTDTWDFNQGINVTGTLTATALAGPLTGNSSTATALATARTIGGVSFDGTANIAVTLAATATALATGRTINGVSFDGTANITVVDSTMLPLAGGTLSGTVDAADQILQRPVMKDYAETKVAMAAHAVDLSLGNVQTYTLSGNQTLTFTNPPASGSAGSFTLIVTNGASATLTWPTSVDWAGGTAPTLTASGIDILTFTTIDGGTIWYGFLAGADMK